MSEKIFPILVLVVCFYHISCSSSPMGADSAVPIYQQTLAYEGGARSRVQAALVKTGSIRIKVTDVRRSGERLEALVLESEANVNSMERQESGSHSAEYQIRVPVKKLIPMMNQLAQFGKVVERREWVDDRVKDAIRFRVKLRTLRKRRERFVAMLDSANELDHKIEIEKILSKLDSEIYEIDLLQEELKRFVNYSKLKVAFERKRIRGPMGILWDGMSWGVSKLFTLRS